MSLLLVLWYISIYTTEQVTNSLMKIIKKVFKKLFKSDLEDRIKILEEKIIKLELKVNTTSKEAGSVRRFGQF